MRKLVTQLLLCICTATTLHAQPQQTFKKESTIERNAVDNTVMSAALSSDANYKIGQAAELFRDYLQLNINETQLVLRNSSISKTGITTERYDQYYNGIKVENGVYTVMYGKDSRAYFINGNFYKSVPTINSIPALSEKAAVAKALQSVKARKYAWEIDGLEQQLKIEKKDSKATYYPIGELVWIEDYIGQKSDRKLYLAYKINVYAVEPLSRHHIYVDAKSGKILHKKSLIDQINGTGTTLYSGPVSFKTSILSGVNRLRDSTRGLGINTFSCANTTGTTVVDVTSASTVWATDAALDAHWGASKVFDYFMLEQGRSSFDDAGAAINSYVHFGVNYNNAFWNGSQMVYGDGSGLPSGFSPLTSLDVCAHEIGHAICQYTADLIYEKESGAMNEGFSDIWAAIIEEYADPHETDAVAKNKWKIGEEIGTNPIRRMDNPNIRYQPDTYGGSYWVNVTGCTPADGNDYCGVHTNSGVLNYWFYLLCTGGSGTNDLSNAFSVTGIGTAKGADIAYQTELMLTPTSTYATCRTASISAATALYGICSPEVEAVTRAWYAVGVGSNYTTPSLPAITGANIVCTGNNVTFSIASVGGTWSSSNASIATIGSTTGIVAGVASGTARITYSSGACISTKIITVNTLPATITGATMVCAGNTANLSSTTGGGTWTSSHTGVATIGTSGIVTGVAAGTTTISYSLSGGCSSSVIFTVNAAPTAITGTASVNVGSTTTLSSTTSGGTWSSSLTAIATVGSSTGIVTGIASGNTIISYTLNGCAVTRSVAVTGPFSTPYIFTIAGTGTNGYSGDGGLASAAKLNGPHGIDIDATGNIFINDISNHVIRKVNASGIITTVVGIGTSGYSGDGGPATAARINQVFDVITDAAGNIYIGDGANHRIRKISAEGIITTIAGNGTAGYAGDGAAATAAMINRPGGVALDNAGNVYFTEIYGHRVRKINVSTGIISTIAGTGIVGYTGNGGAATAARLSYPNFLHIDAANNIYITDNGNHSIRKVNTSGIITTIAGTGIAGFAGDGGAASSAKLTYPGGIEIDASGNIFIADNGNQRIRRINTTGIISTYAGTGTAGFSGDCGAATAAKINLPTDVALDAYGNLHVVDNTNHRIRKITNSIEITGTQAVCAGGTFTLTGNVFGGTWSSSNTSVATIGTANGVVSGIAAGTSTISYSFSGGCGASVIVTVYAAPAVITGLSSICVGATTALSSATVGGVWASSNVSVATVGTSGIVTGIAEGNAGISYTIAGCSRTMSITVNEMPAITIEATTICAGATITLSSSAVGGTWASSNTSVATVGTSGIVTGIAAGTAAISYILSGGCNASVVVTVNEISPIYPVELPFCGLLAWYPFSGNTNNSFGSIPAGRITNATLTTDRFGNANSAYRFNGNNSRITIDSAFFNIGWDNYTISCWSNSEVLINTQNGNRSQFAFNTIPHNGLGLAYNWHLSSKYSMYANSYPAPFSWDIIHNARSQGSIAANTWRHLVMKKNSGNTYSFYLNGVHDTTYSSSVLASDYYCKFVMGNNDSSVGFEGFWGKLDDYGIWNCALTDSEIWQLYTMSSSSLSLCAGNTLALANATSGGTWISGNTAVATIGSTSGIVIGVAAGTATISYIVGSGCTATTIVAVNAATIPGSITGSSSVDIGDTIMLSYAESGGTWSASNSNATVSAAGVVSGITPGTVLISYSFSSACGTVIATKMVTVNAILETGITGTLTVCTGSTTALSNATGGGAWSSSNSGIATINSVGLVTGISAGTVVISYSVFGTSTTAIVTVNPLPNAGTIAGANIVCASSIVTLTCTVGDGAWSSGNTSIATVGSSGIVTGVANGTVTISYTVTNVCGSLSATKILTVNPLPLAGTISGPSTMCTGTTISLSTTGTGGSWISGTPSLASISSDGVVTATALGNVTITYRVTNGCGVANTTHVITVNAAPAVGTIAGPSTLCTGSNITLTIPTSGGAWSSTNTGVATIGSTGVVSGVAAGTATISYLVTGGCGGVSASKVVTVVAIPDAGTISGSSSICRTTTITFTSTVLGGTWSSNYPAGASVNPSTGLVTGLAAGSFIISYRMVNGCGTATATFPISVLNAPVLGAISGATTVCEAATTTLANTTTGGIWSSTNTAAATIAASTGVATGVAAGTTTISYTVSNICGSATVSRVLTVNPLPVVAAISGTASLSVGTTTTLTATPALGTWLSSSSAIASVNTSGVVTGMSAGSSIISYNRSNTCGTATATVAVTVTAAITPITGTLTVCRGATTTLANATPGGTWSTADGAIAIIGTAGVVTGITSGTTTVTYTFSGGGNVTATVTVNSAPAAYIGSGFVCTGSQLNLGSIIPGCTWTSSNTARATVVSTTGIVTGGSSLGTVNISYTNAATCRSITQLTVNAAVGATTGISSPCVGSSFTALNSTPGGTWSSSNTARATIDASSGLLTAVSGGTVTISYTVSAGCVRTTTVTVGTPPSITGNPSICFGQTSLLSSSGGTWSSSNTSIASVAANGIVTGISLGNAVITYRSTANALCFVTQPVTVNPLPSPIVAPSALCPGQTAILTSSPAGGTWTSNFPAKASVDPSTGVVTAVIFNYTTISAVNITYTLPTGCGGIATVTINPLPSPIGGNRNICVAGSTTLTSSTTGGTWSSASPALATGAAGGVVTGVSAGLATISYTNTLGCANTAEVTVNAMPGANTGSASLCLPTTATTTLSNPAGAGTWTSSNTTKATVNFSSGLVTGINTGTANITYTKAAGCTSVTQVTVTICGSRPGMNEDTDGDNSVFSVSPNPTTGAINLTTDVVGKVVIYTIDGKQLQQYEAKAGTTSILMPAGLASGVYMLRFNGADGSSKMVRLVYQ